MSDNWIVANLENAFNTWNDKMAEIWSLITTSPQSFRGGAVWSVVEGIIGGLQAIGYGLLVLFFAMSVFKSTASFRDFQRPEYALRHFIRFVAAKRKRHRRNRRSKPKRAICVLCNKSV